MALEYRLGDADRERLGCPEWLPLDLLDVTLDDLTELSDRFVFDLEAWPDVFFGPKDEDGEYKPPKWALRAAIWMALRQWGGSFVSWDDVGKLAILRVTSRTGDQGKAPDPSDSSGSTPPENSETSTTPPSSTSSPDSDQAT